MNAGSLLVLILLIVRVIALRKRGGAAVASGLHFRLSVYGFLKVVCFIPLLGTVISAGTAAVELPEPRARAVAWAYFTFTFCGSLTWFFPWIVARATIVPLRAHRFAYYFGRVAGVLSAYSDVRGGACLLATLALARNPTAGKADIDWIARRLDGKGKQYGAWVGCHALLHALRREDEPARALFLMCELLAARDCAPGPREVAQSWLVADLARRGLWQLIPRFTDPLPKQGPHLRPAPRWRWTARALAREIAGVLLTPWQRRWRDINLFLRWRLSPHWREVRARFELVARHEPPTAPAPAPVHADGAAMLAHARTLHQRLLTQAHPVTARDIVRVAEAWDEVRSSDQVEAHIAARAHALGMNDEMAARSIFSRLLGEVEEDLYRLIVGAELPLARFRDQAQEPGPTLEGCLETAREELISAFENAAMLLEERKRSQRDLSTLEECAEVGRLRDLHLRAVGLGGDDVAPLLFPLLHDKMSHFGVWLENRMVRERFVSHPIFRWLLLEAYVARDQDAITLEARNVAVTRFGRT